MPESLSNKVMDICIRKAEDKDLPIIHTMEESIFSMAYSEDTLRSTLNSSSEEIYVAVYQEEIAGYIIFSKVFDEAELIKIAVNTLYRNEGIGALLMEKMIEEAGDEAMYFLEVRSSNQSAIRLYEKYGFAEVGLRKNYYKDPTEDALIMNRIKGD